MTRLALLLALALAPGQLAAQTSPLTGEWTVNMAVGMRIENGAETPIMATGALSIVAQGDSLIATLTMQPPPGAAARPPQRMAAKSGVSPAVFVAKSQAKLNMNGEEMVRTATSTYSLTASGDSLTGTLARVIEGMDFPSSPLPVTGTRAKK